MPAVILDDLSTGDRRNAPPGLPVYVGDIADSALVSALISEHNVTSVIHLAGKILPNESLHNPILYFLENTSKSISLINSCISSGVTNFVFSSTAAVYGITGSAPVSESSATNPISPYGKSKLIIEEVLSAVSIPHELNTTVLRYFNVAGNDPALRCGPRGENPGHIIRAAVDVVSGVAPMLTVFGGDYETPDGTCIRDYIHVSDLAHAHIVALTENPAGEAFRIINCGYGAGASVLDVVHTIEAVTGRPLPYEIGPRRPGDPISVVADTTKISSLPGWNPRHEGLVSIIESALQWQQYQRLG